MKGVIFAAGIGSRLKPFTDRKPKALATINGKALLGYAIEKLVSSGADGIIVNVHHFPGQIIDYLSTNYGSLNIEISDESELLLDTGGALAKIGRDSRLLSNAGDSEPVIVTNADVITDMDFVGMVNSHKGKTRFSTILVNSKRESSRKLLFDNEGRLHAWHDYKNNITRPAGAGIEGLNPAAFGCVHIMNVSSIRRIASEQGKDIKPFGIIDYYLVKCPIVDIHAYEPKGLYRWHDIGTPAKLEDAREDFS